MEVKRDLLDFPRHLDNSLGVSEEMSEKIKEKNSRAPLTSDLSSAILGQ